MTKESSILCIIQTGMSMFQRIFFVAYSQANKLESFPFFDFLPSLIFEGKVGLGRTD